MGPWLLGPYKSRTDLLRRQFRQISKLLIRLGELQDMDPPLESLSAGAQFLDRALQIPEIREVALRHFKENELPPPNLLYDVLALAFADDNRLNKLGESYSVNKFGVFDRGCFNGFLDVMRRHNVEGFFPARFLFFDFDDVKGSNHLFGYDETDRLIGKGVDVVHHVARTHRKERTILIEGVPQLDERTLPDLVFQVKSGDEMALLMPRARSLEECEKVKIRIQAALRRTAAILLKTLGGGCIAKVPSMTFACAEIRFEDREDEVIERALGEISRKKDLRKRRSS